MLQVHEVVCTERLFQDLIWNREILQVPEVSAALGTKDTYVDNALICSSLGPKVFCRVVTLIFSEERRGRQSNDGDVLIFSEKLIEAHDQGSRISTGTLSCVIPQKGDRKNT